MKDRIIRGMAHGNTVRFFGIEGACAVQEAMETHNMSPLAAVALGRTLMATGMMGEMLKNKTDSITLQINGEGPIGNIIAIGDALGRVKGYVNNSNIHLPLTSEGKFDVARAVGQNGYINVIKDMGLKEPYGGMTDLVSGEIAEDLASYFTLSDQIPSAVALGVLVDKDGSILKAGGYIIQMMPGGTSETSDKISRNIENTESVTNLLNKGLNIEEIIRLILDDEEINVLNEKEFTYVCDCSRERIEKGIISIGQEELQEIIESEGKAEVICHFCAKKYLFNKDELIELKKSSKKKQ